MSEDGKFCLSTVTELHFLTATLCCKRRLKRRSRPGTSVGAAGGADRRAASLLYPVADKAAGLPGRSPGKQVSAGEFPCGDSRLAPQSAPALASSPADPRQEPEAAMLGEPGGQEKALASEVSVQDACETQPVQRRTGTACSTSTATSVGRTPAPWSTAATPSRCCSPTSRNGASRRRSGRCGGGGLTDQLSRSIHPAVGRRSGRLHGRVPDDTGSGGGIEHTFTPVEGLGEGRCPRWSRSLSWTAGRRLVGWHRRTPGSCTGAAGGSVLVFAPRSEDSPCEFRRGPPFSPPRQIGQFLDRDDGRSGTGSGRGVAAAGDMPSRMRER